MLKDPSIDVVSIASYDECHAEQVLLALQHDKHVFVEKPLCLYEADAVAIRAALRSKPHLHLASNLTLRLRPRFQAIREQVRRGRLGRLFHVEGDYLYGRLHKLTDGWRGRTPGYSVTLGGAVHMVDLLLWISGDRVVEVRAVGNRISSEISGSAFRNDDMVVALLSFESGCVGKVSANFGCVMPHAHYLHLFGTEGSILNRPSAAEFHRSRSPSAAPVLITDPVGPEHKSAGIASFVDSILLGAELFVTPDEVFEALAVCFAIDQSLQTGRPEQVKPL